MTGSGDHIIENYDASRNELGRAERINSVIMV